ncbi:MAG: presqualene diphosphate synthase HpnD [Alphaproteobacteria bacterium]|nr:MAG: presqualene diphosphate synthase HpnD [Alphaproteobacteria bacterium]
MSAAPATSTEAGAVAEARQVVARSGSSFQLGMRVLPKARREAMYAIYAFCRAIDDIADEPGTRAGKLTELDAWRGEIENLYDGRPSRRLARALATPVAEYDLPKAEFLALIDGMEMDAREAIQAPSWDDYRLYCRRVAGAVGMLSVRVFGETGPAADELAVTLGEALQTTNILRDLAEDAERGRVYLPRELLDAHGLPARDPAALLAAPGLAPACAELAAHARSLFGRARESIAACDRRRIRPALLMLEIYQRLLKRLERRGWDRPKIPVKVPRIEKLWVALRYGLI